MVIMIMIVMHPTRKFSILPNQKRTEIIYVIFSLFHSSNFVHILFYQNHEALLTYLPYGRQSCW
jgi:hypothetical protein